MLKFVKILEAEYTSDALRLTMLGEDGQQYSAQWSDETVALLTAALLAALNKAGPDRPEAKGLRGTRQMIRPSGCYAGLTGEGEPILQFSLGPNLVLPFLIPRNHLPSLRSIVASLDRLSTQTGTKN